jgi:hypothetical protein
MGKLSELWFRLIEKISIIIYSFIFFWSALFYLIQYIGKIAQHFEYLNKQTGNKGYLALKSLTIDAGIAIETAMFLAPFIIAYILLPVKHDENNRK